MVWYGDENEDDVLVESSDNTYDVLAWEGDFSVKEDRNILSDGT